MDPGLAAESAMEFIWAIMFDALGTGADGMENVGCTAVVVSTEAMSGICCGVVGMTACDMSGEGGWIAGGPGGVVPSSVPSPTNPPSAEKSEGGSSFWKRTVPPKSATRITWSRTEIAAEWLSLNFCARRSIHPGD
jgi:hypothetical protein